MQKSLQPKKKYQCRFTDEDVCTDVTFTYFANADADHSGTRLVNEMMEGVQNAAKRVYCIIDGICTSSSADQNLSA